MSRKTRRETETSSRLHFVETLLRPCKNSGAWALSLFGFFFFSLFEIMSSKRQRQILLECTVCRSGIYKIKYDNVAKLQVTRGSGNESETLTTNLLVQYLNQES